MKREIGGESFLIPVGKTVYETNGLFYLTELGAFIWDLIPQADNEEDILRAVLEEYEVDEVTAKNDIARFLNKLRIMDIL